MPSCLALDANTCSADSIDTLVVGVTVVIVGGVNSHIHIVLAGCDETVLLSGLFVDISILYQPCTNRGLIWCLRDETMGGIGTLCDRQSSRICFFPMRTVKKSKPSKKLDGSYSLTTE